MEAELAFTDLIWGDDRIQVSFSGDTMTWRAGEDILKFVAVDTEPVAPTLPPQTSFGPLDCGDAVVVRDTVPASGSDFDSFAVEGRSLIEGIEDVSRSNSPSRTAWSGLATTTKAPLWLPSPSTICNRRRSASTPVRDM
jgi:hypothetical protein